MPTITYINGEESPEFVGFDFEPDLWNVGLIGEWSTHTSYMPLGSFTTEGYQSALDRFNSAYNVTSCGVRPIMTKGSVEVDPSDLDDTGNEIQDCGECGNCTECAMWEEYFEYCKEVNEASNN